jgi:hypothetical protein
MGLKPRRTPPPRLGSLAYLYIGTDDFAGDLSLYLNAASAEKVWEFRAFDTQVAALRVSAGPLLLLAEHRPAPSCLPVFAVENIEATVKAMRTAGWEPSEGPVEIPDGTCYIWRDHSGNEIAVFQNDRPQALVGRYRASDTSS